MADRPDFIPSDLDHADAPPRWTEQDVLEALAESEADEAAGRLAPWDEVKARMLAEIEAYEARASASSK